VSRRPCIAIDGPVAAGKSTVARLVADQLGYAYIDSGAMYRAAAWAARQAGVSPSDPQRMFSLLDRIRIRVRPQSGSGNLVYVNSIDVTNDIRSQEIGELASKLSEIPEVRRRLVALQRQLARGGGVVMEGRDIQTVVLPDAEVKIFLVAPPEERARRRHLELEFRQQIAGFDEVLAEITARDRRDSHREDSPLAAAPDAVRVDTGGLTIEQVVQRVVEVAKAKGAGGPRQEQG